jgi:hypothetical protein
VVSCGGGAGVAAFGAGVEGLEDSAFGVPCAFRDEGREGVTGTPALPEPEGDCPPGLLDRRPLRPRVL